MFVIMSLLYAAQALDGAINQIQPTSSSAATCRGSLQLLQNTKNLCDFKMLSYGL